MEIEPSPQFCGQIPTVNSHQGALLFRYQAAPLGSINYHLGAPLSHYLPAPLEIVSCYCLPHVLQKCAP